MVLLAAIIPTRRVTETTVSCVSFTVLHMLQLIKHGRKLMIRLIAVAAFALAVATPAQAMSPAPLLQPDGMTTQVAVGCGVGRTRVGGVCVARTTKRHVRRAARRCAVGVTC